MCLILYKTIDIFLLNKFLLICLYEDSKRWVLFFLSAIIKYSQYVLSLLLPKRKYQPFSIFQQGTDKSLSQVKFALLNYKYAMQFFLLNNNLVHVQHRCNFSIRNLPKVHFLFFEVTIHLSFLCKL